ncbi:MAG: ATP synthase F1 subunit delta [Bacteroidales bacterium]|nr:ATP synthase F1 subunit delta [Bacteroidales bacterium]
MNTGIIASRYATALLKLVDETGSGEVVVAQSRSILNALESIPDLRRALTDPSVPSDKIISLFETVVAGDRGDSSGELRSASDPAIAPELRKFLKLLDRNGRIGDIALTLKSFEDQYYDSRGIVRGKLTLSSPPDAAANKLKDGLKTLIEKQTGKTLLLTTEVDESLIGGFVLEVEDRLLDASVSRQLDIIKNQFVEKNRRIV